MKTYYFSYLDENGEEYTFGFDSLEAAEKKASECVSPYWCIFYGVGLGEFNRETFKNNAKTYVPGMVFMAEMGAIDAKCE